MITAKYDRNTITCITAKYGRIRSVYGMYTVVYDTLYDRLPPYMESITIDLGGYVILIPVFISNQNTWPLPEPVFFDRETISYINSELERKQLQQ